PPPITATSNPPAGSTTSQAPTVGSARSCMATAAKTPASAAVGTDPSSANRRTSDRGATATATAASDGTTSNATARDCVLVTEAPQRGAVARSELREDSLVEDRRHEHDERQIEDDPELDRERRGAR